MGLLAARQAEMAEAVVSWSRLRSRIAMIDSLAWAQGITDSLKTDQLPAVYIPLPGSCFARICKPFRNTRPRAASNCQDGGEPTPIFQGGCIRLSLRSHLQTEAARLV